MYMAEEFDSCHFDRFRDDWIDDIARSWSWPLEYIVDLVLDPRIDLSARDMERLET
jgi:hypothetical protein